ncbi:MAG TPA: reactive intermediate/imine deaminase [Gammaproteobacteria bacterium]|nr:reactive intermediate/imine deaminase [Gammaproteobacteria bacterium]|tara:strand:+ start:1731 stop:2114 length:384 start_codon:yes stop_codon:yes gene_type:complete
MNKKESLSTLAAPEAIGPYSQAIKVDSMVFISGQIPLDPSTMAIVGPDIDSQISQVLRNLKAVCQNAGGELDDVVKFTVYLTNLEHFTRVNTIMQEFLSEPYPARAAVEVVALPRGAQVEIDAIMVI